MSGSVLLMSRADEQSLSALRSALREDGYELLAVTTVEDALQQARQAPPVALILDTDIQSASDLSLCHWLRTDPTTVAVKLLVTARTARQRLAALEAGADELLSAPLDWVEVRTRLRTMQVGNARLPSLEDFLAHTPDLILGGNPVDVLGNADLLSHDLKSPVTIIASSLELLKEYTQDRLHENDTEAEYELHLIDNALLASHRLLTLINDMIDLAKLEVDAFPLKRERFDLAALAREVVEQNGVAIAQKSITVTVQAPDSLPDVIGDRDMTARICNALLDNTLKFAHTDDRVILTLYAEGRYVILELVDHGRPIMPAYQDSIFERAIQWEARQQGSRTSVAMGLPFSRTAARRMDGDLTVRSDPTGSTTTFCLRLPGAETSSSPA